MLLHNLKIAFRNIINNRKSYVLNITGLIIALTVCFLTLFYAVFEHSYEKLRFKTENIYSLYDYDEMFDFWHRDDISVGLSEHLLKNTPGVKNVITYTEKSDFQIEVDENRFYKEWTFHFVDTNYMNAINKTTIAGNCLLKNPDDLLLTKRIALKYFGTTNCIGKKLTVHNEDEETNDFTVSGVFDYPVQGEERFGYNLVARIDKRNQLDSEFDIQNSKQETEAYLVLDENADHVAILEQIRKYNTENINKNYYDRKEIKLSSPKEQYFFYRGKKIKTAIIISLIILLVAIINFIIYNNAQFWERSKSIGIHKINGSKPFHIFSLSFSEFFIINFLSILIAFGLAVLLLPYVKIYMNETINLDYLPVKSLFMYGIILAIVISILTSLSSLYLSTRQPIKLLSQLLNKGVKEKVFNSTLITLQVGTTVFLMIMFFATSRQLKFVQNIDWGFNAEQVMFVNGFEKSPERFYDFRNRLETIPGVIASSGCWHVPPDGDKFFIGYFDENGNRIMIDRNGVGYSFFSLMGIKFKSGRDFDPDLDQPKEHIIVNQEYLDVKGIINPYDTLVRNDDREAAKSIIGVIDDYHMRGMHEKITPQLYELNPNETRKLLIKITPKNVMETLDRIEEEYKAVAPDKEFSMGFIEDEIQNLYENQRNFNTLISYYTIISLLIASMGLFGFVLSEMNKRIKEIGIRKVNGAKVSEILALLNKDLIKWVSLAFIVASPIAYMYINKWLDNFAYRTTISWWIFGMSGIVTLSVAILTVSWQSWRAASKNPVEALRYE